MDFLFDTNALLWMAISDPRILPVNKIIHNRENSLFVSVISFWEIAIKLRVGKINVNLQDLRSDVLNNDFYELQLSANHVLSLLSLPKYHKDPFDHILISQAKCEKMTIITGDKIFKEYIPETIIIVNEINFFTRHCYVIQQIFSKIFIDYQ